MANQHTKDHFVPQQCNAAFILLK